MKRAKLTTTKYEILQEHHTTATLKFAIYIAFMVSYLPLLIVGRRKTLWWNQQARLRKLQAAAMKRLKMRDPRLSSGFRGSPKQAICPFCYKVFYDKSTMNRHVSKRVCLGLQFQNPTLIDDEPSAPVIADVRSTSPLVHVNVTPDSIKTEISVNNEETTKSSRIPCPYCNKLMKGERGVRKHLDFYGCPMAVGAKTQ